MTFSITAGLRSTWQWVRRRLRLRYTLRWALLAITVLCVVLGLWARSAKRQQRAVQQLQADHIWCIYEDADESIAPEWLRTKLGDDYFLNVKEVGQTLFSEKPFSDEHMTLLADLPQLKQLDVVIADFMSHDGLMRVSKLTSLETVWLGSEKIDDEVLACFAKMPNLRSLSLYRGSFTGAGLERLTNLHKLTEVRIGGPNIDDRALHYLSQMPQLEVLTITSPKITDVGVAQLQSLVNLRRLELDCSYDTDEGTTNTITDAGVAYLGALPKLERLVLTETGVSDASVELLYEMKHLRELFLPQNGKISDESQRALRAALPSTRIVIWLGGTRPSYMRSNW